MKSGKNDFALYRRLFFEVRPFWWHLAGLFLLSVITTPLTLLSPIPLKITVDSILGDQPVPQWLRWIAPQVDPSVGVGWLAGIAALLVLIALLKQLLDLGYSLLSNFTGEKLILSFRSKLFRHTQGLSLSYHDRQGTADSAYRIQYDAPAIQWIMVDSLIPLIGSVITLAAMVVVMVRIDWTLAAVALTVAPILFFTSQVYSRKLKTRWREAKDLESSTLAIVSEVLSSVRVVKAFAAEDREHGRYVASASKNMRQQVKVALTGGSFSLIIGMSMAIGTAAVLFLAARHVQLGRITLGELILVMSYLAMLYSPLQTLSKSAANLQGSLVSAERAFTLLDAAPEVAEDAEAQPLKRAQGHITIDHVSFGYESARPALHDVSLEIPAGSCVGISGTTGAGKSTLISLLLRLYDPTSGRILLDGRDIRTCRVRDLRNQFAIVLQEPVLFAGSIRENIAYANPEASDRMIEAAAIAAGAHHFISSLPLGYHTEVGERGVQLSGGERQRISIARAFLKDAPILILDEPTSSVDTQTESLIMTAMRRLTEGRTTFMIAHRLSTLEMCDVRVQLEAGRVVSVTRHARESRAERDGVISTKPSSIPS